MPLLRRHFLSLVDSPAQKHAAKTAYTRGSAPTKKVARSLHIYVYSLPIERIMSLKPWI